MAADDGLGVARGPGVLPHPLAVELDEPAPEAVLPVRLADDEPAELVVALPARDADRAHGRERRREAQQDVRRARVEPGAPVWRR